MKYDREKSKEGIRKRTLESYDRREGDVNLKYFREDLNIPFWLPKSTIEEPYVIDIIPFLAGNSFPQVDKKNSIQVNDPVYFVEVYIHENIGPMKQWIVCPARNYGNPCPVCEEIDKLSKDGQEWEDYKEIALRRRCVYNIVVRSDTKEELKGVQVWEVSYKYSEKPIQLAAKSPRGGGIVPFSDPDEGKSIAFEIGKDEFRTIQGHKLVDRDSVISDKILNSTFVLDELLKKLTYNEIFKLFKGLDKDDNKSVTKVAAQNIKDPSELVCKSEGKFGYDIDRFEFCSECKVYNECAIENDKIETLTRERREKNKALKRRD